jgi:predicted nucleic-acid-binding protein
MIGLDTNILVRYITHDHPAQTAMALELMDSLNPDMPGFISLIVLVELIWVLESFYRATKSEIVQSLDTLLRSKELIVERADIAWQALARFKASNCEYADCLIERCGHAAACDYSVTFDQRAARAAGMKLLK